MAATDAGRHAEKRVAAMGRSCRLLPWPMPRPRGAPIILRRPLPGLHPAPRERRARYNDGMSRGRP